MRTVRVSLLLVLVVWAWSVTAALTAASEPVEDGNEPWIAAEHLAPGWRSMALTTRYYNPEDPALGNRPPQRSLSFAGRIDVIDPNGLIGLSEVAMDALAFDEAGSQIHVVGASQQTVGYGYTSQVLLYQPPRYLTKLDASGRTISIAPYEFSIDMSMRPNAPFPLVLSRLEWSMSAVLSDVFEAIDIPFVLTSDWIELVPGLEVFVEQAIVQEGKYSYRIKARYDPNKISYLGAQEEPPGFTGRRHDTPYTWSSQVSPEMIATAIDVVDAEGNSIWNKRMQSGHISFGTGSGFSDSGGQRIAMRYGSGTCSECGNVAFLRHIIAFEPYHRELRFVLEDVLVPGF